MRGLYEPQAILPDGVEVTKPAASRRSLERAAIGGDSPVGESDWSSSGVRKYHGTRGILWEAAGTIPQG